jgi:hypothetical protein
MEISPENALAGYLQGREHRPHIVQPARVEALRRIRDAIGGALFIGRTPKDVTTRQDRQSTTLAVSIQEVSVDVPQDLSGEHDIQEALIEIVVHARGGSAGRAGKALAGHIRVAISNYVGEWGYDMPSGELAFAEIHAAVLDRPYSRAWQTRDGSEDWLYQWRSIARIMFKQFVIEGQI